MLRPERALRQSQRRLEEGVSTAATAAEFGLVFEAYAQLEQAKMEKAAREEGDKLPAGCWLADGDAGRSFSTAFSSSRTLTTSSGSAGG